MITLPLKKRQNPQAQQWQYHLDNAPKFPTKKIDLTQDIITIGDKSELTDSEHEQVMAPFKAMTPWRKGPYKMFGALIDSEWQCQLKFNRLSPHLPDLSQKTVLDIGCNSGYFSFRLAGLNAKKVIAIDPTTLYFFQFHLLNSYAQVQTIEYLPIGFEDLTEAHMSDIILNMGILYHHPNPIDCLTISKKQLTENGILFLETLIIDDKRDISLTPTDRYAGMKNVYHIPSIPLLTKWLKDTGFSSIEILDISTTTPIEQRSTPWSSPHSLKNVLTDTGLTIEGYPGPRRALIKATKI